MSSTNLISYKAQQLVNIIKTRIKFFKERKTDYPCFT